MSKGFPAISSLTFSVPFSNPEYWRRRRKKRWIYCDNIIVPHLLIKQSCIYFDKTPRLFIRVISEVYQKAFVFDTPDELESRKGF